LRSNKRQLLRYQASIAKIYFPVFDSIQSINSPLQFINAFTKGIARKLGERLLFKWRKRQINMAILYYHDRDKFERRLAAVNRKKQRIDNIILRRISFLL
jgi:hypothetical protein